MIDFLSVKGFQSLDNVEIALSPFTVIVGPSSSGKSALTRALKTLTANARGNAFISTWAKTATIEADYRDRGRVRLVRGKTTDSNSYTIFPPAGPMEDAPETIFTKLGGEVPPEVSDFLGITPKDPLHFAGQFDKPFLLDDSPAEVARTLAALTNVSVVFAAAREANRTRLATNATLKIRRQDLEAVRARSEEFAILRTYLAAQNEAEKRLTVAHDLQSRIKNLRDALQTISTAEATVAATQHAISITLPHTALENALLTHQRIESLRAVLSALETSQATIERTQSSQAPLVDTEAAYAALGAFTAYRDTIRDLQVSKQAAAEAHVALRAAIDADEQAHTKHAELLHALGSCPTCGQSTAPMLPA